MKSTLRLPFVLMALCAWLHGIPQAAAGADSEKDQDVYAIYSLVLANLTTSHGQDDNQRYLIAATTASPWSQEPCVQPPKGREADFQEVLADYQQRKSTPRKLQPAFSVNKPYELLSESEASAFMKERGSSGDGNVAPSAKFQGVDDLFTLSDVYFNQKRTLALTAISSWCGNPCGLEEWKVFEKLDTGKWEERKWVTCQTVSRRSDDAPFPKTWQALPGT